MGRILSDVVLGEAKIDFSLINFKFYRDLILLITLIVNINHLEWFRFTLFVLLVSPGGFCVSFLSFWRMFFSKFTYNLNYNEKFC